MKRPPLRSFRVENFKSIRDSGRVNFGPLPVFVGNNGAGKSSLIEALETERDIALFGVDEAFRRWRGFEHVWNKSREHIIIVEREDGQSVFRRPDKKQLAAWSKSFSPGRLYTMGRLTRKD